MQNKKINIDEKLKKLQHALGKLEGITSVLHATTTIDTSVIAQQLTDTYTEFSDMYSIITDIIQNFEDEMSRIEDIEIEHEQLKAKLQLLKSEKKSK